MQARRIVAQGQLLPCLREFTIGELNTYTNRFAEEIGRGRHGTIYRGMIIGCENFDGMAIAVKVVLDDMDVIRLQWQAEIAFLQKFNHDNIIRLIGKAEEAGRLYLVYQQMTNGNVEEVLADIDWSTTLKILQGTASALEVLHNHSPSVVLRDLKSASILLDDDFNPKLSGFGLAGLAGHVALVNDGTVGWMDPQAGEGRDEKVHDIFSFGVLTLQLITKRRNLNIELADQVVHIRDWAKTQKKERQDIVHEDLKNTGCNATINKAITKLCFACCRQDPNRRPSAREVVSSLLNLDAGFIRGLISTLAPGCTSS